MVVYSKRSMSNLIYTTLGVKKGFGLTSPNAHVGILDLSRTVVSSIATYRYSQNIY